MKTVIFAFLLSAFASVYAGSRFGVCAHLNRWEFPELGRELDMIRDAGIGFVRTDMDWGQVQPDENSWDFSRWDAVIGEAQKRGIEILPILNGNPHFAKVPSENLGAWGAYVKKCVERYRGRVKYWEVFNEPDLAPFWRDDPGGYFKALKCAYETIKEADPSAVVLTGGFAGVPEKYIEELFKLGASDFFDVMNVHPYDGDFPPEEGLARRLARLRALMQKYGAGGRPVWITEIGNSSGFPDPSLGRLFEAALKKLGVDVADAKIAVVADGGYFYDSNGVAGPACALLKNAGEFFPVEFSEIGALDPEECAALALAGSEFFPYEHLEGLLAYVRKGGVLVCGGGIPFYYDIRRNPDGVLERAPKGMEGLWRFRMDVSPHWKMEGVPDFVEGAKCAEGFGGTALGGVYRSYFASAAKLRGGDSFEPIAFASAAGKTLPLGGIYSYGDMKGHVVAFFLNRDNVTTEGVQAALLPRAFLIAFAEGVEKVFQYNFRSNEIDSTRESHFGMVRKNMEKKPAYAACKTLVEMLGCGFSEPLVQNGGGVFCASWKTGDGDLRRAFWTPAGYKTALLGAGAENAGRFDIFGAPAASAANASRSVRASPEILYLTGLKKPGRASASGEP